MKLVTSDSPSFPYSFDLSKNELENPKELNQWCDNVIGKHLEAWKSQDSRIWIKDPELALKFKLRWCLADE